MRTNAVFAVVFALDQNPLRLSVVAGNLSHSAYIGLDCLVIRPRDYGQAHSAGAVQDERVEGANAAAVSCIWNDWGPYAPRPNRRMSMGLLILGLMEEVVPISRGLV
jgi:hypothetical protein